MTAAIHQAPFPWKQWLEILLKHYPLWVGSTLTFAALGVGYVITKPARWKGSQPILIRDQVGGSISRLGRFVSKEELKAAQETVVEMARNPEVIEAALVRLGPPKNADAADLWPSSKTVEDYSKKGVSVRPPKGSEFGSSEVIYLEALADTPTRAKKLCGLILDQVIERLRSIRRVRAESIINELQQNRQVASGRLEEATARLRAIEATVGPDLPELKGLADEVGHEGGLSRALTEVQVALPVAELELLRLEQLRDLLESGRSDPRDIVFAGEDLLNLQPTLRRLKEGLIDAQLRKSQLAGRFESEHPKMKGAELAEKEILQHMTKEIDSSIEGMEPRLNSARDRVGRLKSKQQDLLLRLEKLANLRTEYSNLATQVKQRAEALGSVDRALSEAEASLTASLTTSFIEPLNAAQVSDRPEGPSNHLLLLGATCAGGAFGLGLVFLVAPAPGGVSVGRRWSDYALGYGRRRSDQVNDRQAVADRGTADVFPPAAAGMCDRRREPR